jgi:tripartite ATP-independent transporter DctM subunit
MLKAGYPPQIAAGAVAAGGTLGILIPPSLILMIYAIIAQQSVAKLFTAALVPGIILTVLYCIVAVIYYRVVTRHLKLRQDMGHQSERALPVLGRIWHVIALFGLTLGGIYFGWFTPTEAAAVGALGALFLGFILRRHTLSDSAECFFETVRLTSSLIFIVLASTIFSYFIVQTEISRHLIDFMKMLGVGPIGFIALLLIGYIVMGCFLEGIGMILITVPIILPLVLAFGYDPVWFGVYLVIVVELGLIHPPMGLNLFAINAVTKEINIFDIYKGSAPFLLAPLVLIVLMVAFPQIVLWLPSRMQ